MRGKVDPEVAMRAALPILAAVLALGPGAPAFGQACGPLDFAFASTGPGCNPGGPGLGFPLLGGTLALSNGLRIDLM